ncbi:MAG: 50S ribosomal protein L11 methyltransferase [Rickettsiales bacterium]|nr:50S ribosomal protein L11 methyltransferase [Rickettsiales bacterium]
MAETYLINGDYQGDSTEDNPFASHEYYTTLTVVCEKEAVPMIELVFEEEALSMSHFEKEKGAHWQMEILLPGKRATVELSHISGIHSHTLENLEMQDWVTENQKDFPPLEIGRFYIHGSHLAPKAGAISLEIDAGRAFGTGEHATTAGCILAMQALEDKAFKKIVDVGCGTGILTLAAKHLWADAFVIGGDMDEPSVDTSIENAAKNGMTGLPFVTAGGMQHDKIQAAAPYDLIIANILAGPLVTLAPEMVAGLTDNGMMILSGLLIRQEEEVLAAYEAQGLTCTHRLHRDEWSALTLQR